jgi:hypothetical protein
MIFFYVQDTEKEADCQGFDIPIFTEEFLDHNKGASWRYSSERMCVDKHSMIGGRELKAVLTNISDCDNA